MRRDLHGKPIYGRRDQMRAPPSMEPSPTLTPSLYGTPMQAQIDCSPPGSTEDLARSVAWPSKQPELADFGQGYPDAFTAHALPPRKSSVLPPPPSLHRPGMLSFVPESDVLLKPLAPGISQSSELTGPASSWLGQGELGNAETIQAISASTGISSITAGSQASPREQQLHLPQQLQQVQWQYEAHYGEQQPPQQQLQPQQQQLHHQPSETPDLQPLQPLQRQPSRQHLQQQQATLPNLQLPQQQHQPQLPLPRRPPPMEHLLPSSPTMTPRSPSSQFLQHHQLSAPLQSNSFLHHQPKPQPQSPHAQQRALQLQPQPQPPFPSPQPVPEPSPYTQLSESPRPSRPGLEPQPQPQPQPQKQVQKVGDANDRSLEKNREVVLPSVEHRIAREVLRTWLGIVQNLNESIDNDFNDFLQMLNSNRSNISDVDMGSVTASAVPEPASSSSAASIAHVTEEPKVARTKTNVESQATSAQASQKDANDRGKLDELISKMHSDDATIIGLENKVTSLTKANLQMQSEVTSLKQANTQTQRELTKATTAYVKSRKLGFAVGRWMAKTFEGTVDALLKRDFFALWIGFVEVQKNVRLNEILKKGVNAESSQHVVEPQGKSVTERTKTIAVSSIRRVIDESLVQGVLLKWHNACLSASMQRKIKTFEQCIDDAEVTANKKAVTRVREHNLEVADRFNQFECKFFLEGVFAQWQKACLLAIMQRRTNILRQDADELASKNKIMLQELARYARNESKFLLNELFVQWQTGASLARMQKKIEESKQSKEDCLRCVAYANNKGLQGARAWAAVTTTVCSVRLLQVFFGVWKFNCRDELHKKISALQEDAFRAYISRFLLSWRGQCQITKITCVRIEVTLRLKAANYNKKLLDVMFSAWRRTLLMALQERHSALIQKCLQKMVLAQDEAFIKRLFISWKSCIEQERLAEKSRLLCSRADRLLRSAVGKLMDSNHETFLQAVVVSWKDVHTRLMTDRSRLQTVFTSWSILSRLAKEAAGLRAKMEQMQSESLQKIRVAALKLWGQHDAVAQTSVFKAWKDEYYAAQQVRQVRAILDRTKNEEDHVRLQMALIIWRNICMSSLRAQEQDTNLENVQLAHQLSQEVEQLRRQCARFASRETALQSGKSVALRLLSSVETFFKLCVFKLWNQDGLHNAQVSKFRHQIQSMASKATMRLFVMSTESLQTDIFNLWKSLLSEARVTAEVRALKGKSREIALRACLTFLSSQDASFLEAVLTLWKEVHRQSRVEKAESRVQKLTEEVLALKGKSRAVAQGALLALAGSQDSSFLEAVWALWKDVHVQELQTNLRATVELLKEEREARIAAVEEPLKAELQEKSEVVTKLEDDIVAFRAGHSSLERFCDVQRLKGAFHCWKSIHIEAVVYRLKRETLQRSNHGRAAVEQLLWGAHHNSLVKDAFVAWKEFFLLSRVALGPEFQRVRCTLSIAQSQLRGILLTKVIFKLWCFQILRFYQQVSDVCEHEEFLMLPSFGLCQSLCQEIEGKATSGESGDANSQMMSEASATTSGFNKKVSSLEESTNLLSQKVKAVEAGAPLPTPDPKEEDVAADVVEERKPLPRGLSAKSWRSLMHAGSPNPQIWEDPEVGVGGEGSAARNCAVPPADYVRSFSERGACFPRGKSCGASQRKLSKGRPELVAASMASGKNDDQGSPLVPRPPVKRSQLSPFVRKPFLAHISGPPRPPKGYQSWMPQPSKP